ncbi:hypothetical protein TWF718_009142 [Orbilia javanica]|uniref:Uncharacterized protein n=1 Tax=Orbilia javanica TaxID=47235 RepID=A0AAN8MR99_9PEZI
MSSQQGHSKATDSTPQNNIPDTPQTPPTQSPASTTLSGATSKDVNKSLGRSVQGMSSRERHSVGKKEKQGVAWTGTVPVDFNAAESKKEAWDFTKEFERRAD